MWVCVVVPVCLGVFCTVCAGDAALDRHHRHNNNKIRSSAEISRPTNQAACKEDSDCPARRYCNHVTAVCVVCQTQRGQCHGDGACCPGLRCINDQCKRTRKKNPSTKRPPTSNEKTKRKKNFQELENCVRSKDCAEGLCCGRYLTSKKCLRIPTEGEACSLPGLSKGRRAVEYCSCAQGLSCHAQDPTSSRGGVCRRSHGYKGDKETRQEEASRNEDG